jgi:hypothetical protein
MAPLAVAAFHDFAVPIFEVADTFVFGAELGVFGV